MMETFDHGTRKARKEHHCSYCNGLINKGEEYNYSVHKMDVAYTWKSHKHCSELTKLLEMAFDRAEGLTYDAFYEYKNKHFQEYYKCYKY